MGLEACWGLVKGQGLRPYHRHPHERVTGGWFAFEVEGSEDDKVAIG